MKYGYLLKEPTGFWEAGFQNRWFELTVEYLAYYETAKVKKKNKIFVIGILLFYSFIIIIRYYSCFTIIHYLHSLFRI